MAFFDVKAEYSLVADFIFLYFIKINKLNMESTKSSSDLTQWKYRWVSNLNNLWFHKKRHLVYENDSRIWLTYVFSCQI